MNANTKKKFIVGGIFAIILIICCTATFICTRRYYTNRIEQLGGGAVESVTELTDGLDKAESSANNVGDELSAIRSRNEELISERDTAVATAEQLRTINDECQSIVEDCNTSIQSDIAEARNDCDQLELILRITEIKVEHYEQSFSRLTELLGSDGTSSTEQ